MFIPNYVCPWCGKQMASERALESDAFTRINWKSPFKPVDLRCPQCAKPVRFSRCGEPWLLATIPFFAVYYNLKIHKESSIPKIVIFVSIMAALIGVIMYRHRRRLVKG